MKSIGKVIVLAMTLSLAVVLTACGGSASSSAASSSASASASSASASASSESASASAASASASSASASASAAAADLNTYENEFFGIKFELPEGWSFMDASEIENINEVIAAASENAELDMVATNGDKNQIVLISIEAPGDSNAGKTADQYLEAQMEQTKANLEGNYTYEISSATVTFEGIDRELPAAITTIEMNGDVKFCVCQAVAEKDGYFLNAIAMGASQDEVTKAFESFRAITA